MNILHIEDEPWDSGIAHYAVSLAAAQAARGHRVRVWGLDGSPVLASAAGHGLEIRGLSSGAARLLDIGHLRAEAASFQPQIVNAHTGAAQFLALLTSPPPSAIVRTRGDARPVSSNFFTRLSASRISIFIAANAGLQASLQSAFPSARVLCVHQGIPGPATSASRKGNEASATISQSRTKRLRYACS